MNVRQIFAYRGLQAAEALWTLATLPVALAADLTLGYEPLDDYVSTTSPRSPDE